MSSTEVFLRQYVFAVICTSILFAKSTTPPTTTTTDSSLNECEITPFVNQKMGMWSTLSNVTYPSPMMQRLEISAHELDDEYWSANNLKPLCFDNNAMKTSNSDPVNERSICPWTLKKNYDPRRLPSVLFEAQCVCNKTVKSQTRFACGEYQCEPVVYQIRVIRFDANCQYYKVGFQNVVAACVPVRLASHQMIQGAHYEQPEGWNKLVE